MHKTTIINKYFNYFQLMKRICIQDKRKVVLVEKKRENKEPIAIFVGLEGVLAAEIVTTYNVERFLSSYFFIAIVTETLTMDSSW